MNLPCVNTTAKESAMKNNRMKAAGAILFGASMVVSFLAYPTGSDAKTSGSVVPEFNVAAMQAAWRDTSIQCRKHVQKVLAEYRFYNSGIDGVWGPSTLDGIKQYVESGYDLEWNTVSYQGALGLIWHIGFAERSCPFPQTSDL
jgi:hypothetical protein